MALRVKVINKGKEIHYGGNEIPSEITNPRKHGVMVCSFQESPARSQEESLFPVTHLFSTRKGVSPVHNRGESF